MRNFIYYILIFASFVSCKKQENKKENNEQVKKNVTVKNTLVNDETSSFLIKNLYGIWAENLDSPHADFEITDKSFFIVDYDGNGDLNYEVDDNKIKVFYPDFVKIGLIKKAQRDTLIIYWNDGNQKTYFRWKD